MLKLKTRIAGWAAIFALLFVILMPATADAAQRRGRGRNDDRWAQQRRVNIKRDWKKFRRFRNGHDARDGRWDRRGPKQNARFDDRFDRNRGKGDDYKFRKGRGRN